MTRWARIVLFLTIGLAAPSTIASPAWGAVTSSVIDDVLTITGNEEQDRMYVSCSADDTVLVNEADPDTGSAPCAEITSIVVTGRGGGDDIDLRRVRLTAFPAVTSATIDGGGGRDSVVGSDAADVIRAEGGDDWIYADLADGDVVDGGQGDDELSTSFESDVAVTADAFTTPTDTLTFASIEVVSVSGGRDPQTIDGRAFSGRLSISGGGGEDRILGGSGKNELSGNRGSDRLVGGPDDDDLFDGYGRGNVLIGKNGDDSLVSYSKGDLLRGGSGDDAFCCVYGGDKALFSGGSGIDTLTAAVNVGTAVLSDSRVTSQGDSARLRSIEEASVTAPDAASGVVIDASRFTGNTRIWGGTFGGDDVLIGGSGRDELSGLDGDDEVSGAAGHDRLDGGPGSDVCDGGPGVDRITHCE